MSKQQLANNLKNQQKQKMGTDKRLSDVGGHNEGKAIPQKNVLEF